MRIVKKIAFLPFVTKTFFFAVILSSALRKQSKNYFKTSPQQNLLPENEYECRVRNNFISQKIINGKIINVILKPVVSLIRSESKKKEIIKIHILVKLF